MSSITLTALTLGVIPKVNQIANVKYRRSSDPDVASSYTNFGSFVVLPNGSFQTPVVITGLAAVNWVVWVTIACSNSSFVQTFNQPANPNVDAFSFTAQNRRPLSSTIISNSINPTGNNVPVSISITGGMYSLNGGAFTASSGTFNPGDSVRVQLTSSGSYSTAVSCTLTLNATTGNFTATTGAQPVINWTMVEGLHPYADTNATLYQNGTPINSFGVTASGSNVMNAGQAFSVRMFNQFYPTGLNPTQSMAVIKNTATVYGPPSIPAANGSNETYTDSVVAAVDDVYIVNIVSGAQAYPNGFTAKADGAMTITNIVGSGATGVPAGFSGLSIAPGTYSSQAYSSLSSGNIDITISGYTPGYTATLYVNDIIVSTAAITAAGTYTLTNPSSVSNPTSVFIVIRNY